MSSNPYENEPGFENAHSEDDKKNQKEYVAKVRLSSHNFNILTRLIPADSTRKLADICDTTNGGVPGDYSIWRSTST